MLHVVPLQGGTALPEASVQTYFHPGVAATSHVSATGAAHLEVIKLPTVTLPSLPSHEQRLSALLSICFAPSAACVPPNLLTNLPFASIAWVIGISKPPLKHRCCLSFGLELTAQVHEPRCKVPDQARSSAVHWQRCSMKQMQLSRHYPSRQTRRVGVHGRPRWPSIVH